MLYTFLSFASVFYLLSAICLAFYIRRMASWSLRYSQVLAGLGILTHAYILIWYLERADSSFQSASLISNLILSGLAAVTAFVIMLRRRALLIAAIILPVLAASMYLISLLAEPYASQALPSAWLWAHIGLMILGELVFFVAASTAAAYMIVYRHLKKKHGFQVLSSVSSLPSLDRVLGILLGIGFLFLSVGLVLGGIFASQFWQGEWWKDAKVIFAALIWLAYLFLLSLRLMAPNFRGRRSAIGALVCFVLVLFLSTGVSYLFPTQHLGGSQVLESAP